MSLGDLSFADVKYDQVSSLLKWQDKFRQLASDNGWPIGISSGTDGIIDEKHPIRDRSPTVEQNLIESKVDGVIASVSASHDSADGRVKVAGVPTPNQSSSRLPSRWPRAVAVVAAAAVGGFVMGLKLGRR